MRYFCNFYSSLFIVRKHEEAENCHIVLVLKGVTETKIGEFHHRVGVVFWNGNENVVWLQVAMDNLQTVQLFKSIGDLPQN